MSFLHAIFRSILQSKHINNARSVSCTITLRVYIWIDLYHYSKYNKDHNMLITDYDINTLSLTTIWIKFYGYTSWIVRKWVVLILLKLSYLWQHQNCFCEWRLIYFVYETLLNYFLYLGICLSFAFKHIPI